MSSVRTGLGNGLLPVLYKAIVRVTADLDLFQTKFKTIFEYRIFYNALYEILAITLRFQCVNHWLHFRLHMKSNWGDANNQQQAIIQNSANQDIYLFIAPL